MKKVLVIGSTVVDVIIDVDHLPTTSGGCTCNFPAYVPWKSTVRSILPI